MTCTLFALVGRKTSLPDRLDAPARDRGGEGSAPGLGSGAAGTGGFPASGRSLERDAQVWEAVWGTHYCLWKRALPAILSQHTILLKKAQTPPSCLGCE